MPEHARFLPSESVRRAEVAIVDAVARICGENDIAYRLLPAPATRPNQASFVVEMSPEAGISNEALANRRTYHWLCRAFALPYDLPGAEVTYNQERYRFLGASLHPQGKNQENVFLFQSLDRSGAQLWGDIKFMREVFKASLEPTAVAPFSFGMGLPGCERITALGADLPLGMG